MDTEWEIWELGNHFGILKVAELLRNYFVTAIICLSLKIVTGEDGLLEEEER